MSVKEFFETLESRVDTSKTAGMNNSYLFDIDGAGKWKVDVQDGKVSVTEGGEDARLHDRQAEGQRRHGRRHEIAEALLSAARKLTLSRG